MKAMSLSFVKTLGVLCFISLCVVIAQPAKTLTIPHIVNGRGWKTEILLVNRTGDAIGGNLQFFNPNGEPGSYVPYRVPGNGSTRVEASAFRMKTETGSVRIIPDAGNIAPSSSALFWSHENGNAIEQAPMEATTGSRTFRLLGEVIGEIPHTANSVRTEIAIANPSSTPARIAVEFDSVLSTAFLIPGNGHSPRYRRTAGNTIPAAPAVLGSDSNYEFGRRLRGRNPALVDGRRRVQDQFSPDRKMRSPAP